MSFLYPQFLYALLSLSIPVIIHLFNFRKTRRVYFSNTRFLQKVKEASSARRKVKHYLILAARLLSIFFLVVAFAQPFLPAAEGDQPGGKVLIYLDNSLSMQNEVAEGVSAFDEAISYINSLTALYPAATEYKILTNNFESYSGGYRNKHDIRDMATEMQTTGITRTFEEIKNRLTLHHDNEEYDIFWLSDFQRSTAGADEIGFDSMYNVNLIPLNFSETQNVFVDSLYLDNPFMIGDEKLKLNVLLRNIGAKEVSNLVVKIYVNELQAATAVLNIASNAVGKATFDLAFNLEGINRCRISFEDYPVTYDNDFYFTINGSRKIEVLEIKNSTAKTPVQSVFGNTELFELKSIPSANLDYNLIPEADLVVLNGLPLLDPSLAVALNKYLEGFGDILLIPASDPDVSSYRQISGMERLELAKKTEQVPLATPDFKDPFFENVFEETRQNFAMPEAAQVIQWGADRTALLKYRNGTPFLSRHSFKGTIYTMASPLEVALTDLHVHAIFVPVMYRIAAESASKMTKLYYYTSDPVVSFKTEDQATEQIYKLKKGEEEVIPVQRISGNNIIMEVPRFAIETGFYDLTRRDQTLAVLAFNHSEAESDLRQLSFEELEQMFQGNVDIYNVADDEQFTASVEKKYIGQPLWKYAVALALLFLLAEVLLIRFLP